MFYVYVIRSQSHPKRHYIGFTENIDQRVKEHNEGKSLHTAKYGPRQLAVYLAVPSKTKALDLERYFKSGSGRGISAAPYSLKSAPSRLHPQGSPRVVANRR
jgi:putative endonuclease